MTRKMQFEFTNQHVVEEPDSYVARLPAKLTSKKALLQALYEHLQLPGYFGFNWDALSDCLRDFHWLKTRTVVLVHSDLPGLSPGECRTYLSVLAEAIDSWRFEDEHTFRVVFPDTAYAGVAAALAM